jgi:hypothetical protein
MAITKEKLMERIKDQFLKKNDFLEECQALVESGKIDLEKLPDDYTPAYAIAHAVYSDHIHGMVTLPGNDKVTRRQRTAATKYLHLLQHPEVRNRIVELYNSRYDGLDVHEMIQREVYGHLAETFGEQGTSEPGCLDLTIGLGVEVTIYFHHDTIKIALGGTDEN